MRRRITSLAALILVGASACSERLRPNERARQEPASSSAARAAPAPRPSAPATTQASTSPSSSSAPAGDAAPAYACTFDLPKAFASIKDVPSPYIAHALIPSLDVSHAPLSMRGKTIEVKDHRFEKDVGPMIEDCHGGKAPALWEDGSAGVPATPPGTVKVIARQSLPEGRQAVWLATSKELHACMAPDGLGFLAIVALTSTSDASRVVVLGVSPWDPGCHFKPRLRAEHLGGETVYVEQDGFGTGAGNVDWENVWTLRDGHLAIAGRYDILRDGGEATQTGLDDAGVYSPPRFVAKPTFVGAEVVLAGKTTWYRQGDAAAPTPVRTEDWIERYSLDNGVLKMKPVPKGATRRPAEP